MPDLDHFANGLIIGRFYALIDGMTSDDRKLHAQP